MANDIIVSGGAPRLDLAQFEGHTPGNWEVQELSSASGGLWLQVGYNGRGPLARTSSPVEPLGGAIAEWKYLVVNEDEQRANARLIAAAPALLEEVTRLRAALAGEVFIGRMTLGGWERFTGPLTADQPAEFIFRPELSNASIDVEVRRAATPQNEEKE